MRMGPSSWGETDQVRCAACEQVGPDFRFTAEVEGGYFVRLVNRPAQTSPGRLRWCFLAKSTSL